jgi:uncharacterized protein (DUF2147 family)
MTNRPLALVLKGVIAIFTIAIGGLATAQVTPVGSWYSIDDKTGEVKSLVVISEKDGVLTGRIDKLLRKGADQNAICKDCTDDRKDKPLLGLEIIRGAKQAQGKDVWEEGTIVNPEGGTVYKLRLTPIDGGQKLEVRGFVGFALLGKTQTWQRAQ